MIKQSDPNCEDLVPLEIAGFSDDGVKVSVSPRFYSGAGTLHFKNFLRSPAPGVVDNEYMVANDNPVKVVELACGNGVSEIFIDVYGGTNDQCEYAIIVPCLLTDLCPTAAPQVGRLLHEDEAFKKDSYYEPDDAMLENMDEVLPYCVSEDFPCEGEEENMVYVCHYSTRSGYRTFCVPEEDSDLLRFYPNDYCGQCKFDY